MSRARSHLMTAKSVASSVALPLLVAAVFAQAAVGAAATQRWVADDATDLLKGRGDGVAITSDGRLQRAPHWADSLSLDEPVVLAAVETSDGELLVGTSHPSVLYRVDRDRIVQLVEVPGDRITAMTLDDDGHPVLAAGTPTVLYRWRRGSLEEVGRLDEASVWDLALFNGRVVAAAGAPAALYRLSASGLERWLELPDRHARSLAADGGRLVVGTSGRGFLLTVDAQGGVGVLADSSFTEISDLIITPDGSVWATALVGEPPPAPKPSNGNGSGNGSSNGNGATKTEAASVDLELPKVNGKTATSEVVRLTPEGALLGVHRFASQVASTLAFDGEGVLVGTGFEGEMWRFVDDGGALLATLDAVQIVGIVGNGRALLTQGPAAVRWRGVDDRPGRFRSPPQAFPRPVRFGEYRLWPETAAAAIRFRTGTSAEDDATWLPWSDWLRTASGSVPLPPGRVLQWELELDGRGETPDLDRIEIAYREVNLAPRITSVTVEDPAVIFLAAPPPVGPVIESQAPDVSGIFTVIDERTPQQAQNAKGKKYYRVGYRTVAWQADDPNDDALRFTLEIERADGVRLPVRERIEGTQLAVDTAAIPDGTYRFLVTASDEAANPGTPRETTRASSWFEVDGTAPEVEVREDDGAWTVIVRDAGGGVGRVDWSRDGDRWRNLAPTDGVLDGREERFELQTTEPSDLIVIRALDRHFNRTTVSVDP